jgi:hypothetical protein
MAVGFCLPNGDNSKPRSHRVEKFLRSGVLSAMMADLQHVGTHRLCAVSGKNLAP